MKIIMLIVFLLSLVSCQNNDLPSKSLYVGALGIEYDNEIVISALISSSNENNTFIIKTSRGENINEALNFLELEESHVINFMHISSIVFNSYIFLTNDKISDLYDIVNKDEDTLLNQLMEPIYSYHIYQDVKPLHLITMGKRIANRKNFIIPTIKIKDSSLLIGGIKLDFFNS